MRLKAPDARAARGTTHPTQEPIVADRAAPQLVSLKVVVRSVLGLRAPGGGGQQQLGILSTATTRRRSWWAVRIKTCFQGRRRRTRKGFVGLVGLLSAYSALPAAQSASSHLTNAPHCKGKCARQAKEDERPQEQIAKVGVIGRRARRRRTRRRRARRRRARRRREVRRWEVRRQTGFPGPGRRLVHHAINFHGPPSVNLERDVRPVSQSRPDAKNTNSFINSTARLATKPPPYDNARRDQRAVAGAADGRGPQPYVGEADSVSLPLIGDPRLRSAGASSRIPDAPPCAPSAALCAAAALLEAV